jgi:peptide/nickel transport system permease protein
VGGYLAKRFAQFLILVVIAASAGYLLAATTLSPRSNFAERNPPVPESTITLKLDALNANPDVPLAVRYGRWVSGTIRGDFGLTINEERMGDIFPQRMAVSVRLLLLGSILGSVIGVIIGVISAVRQYKLFDRSFGFASFVLLSTPVFLVAVLLKYGAIEVNEALGRTVLFTTGMYTPEFDGNWLQGLMNQGAHMILPTLSITLGGIAFYSRYQRNSMLDVLSSDHLRTARAKGLTRRQALFKHGLRVAILPMATFFAYSFGLLVVGATFTEQIFGWYGMGDFFITSIQQNDVNAVAAVTTFSAVLVLFAGLLADVLTASLDPRVRLR